MPSLATALKHPLQLLYGSGDQVKNASDITRSRVNPQNQTKIMQTEITSSSATSNQNIENPPYLDFIDHTLYMGSNNKGLLESWIHFLTKSHIFASSGTYELATEQRFAKPVKYEAKIIGVSSAQALQWIATNFDPKKHPPYHPIPEWKRPEPVAPKPSPPAWIVRVELVDFFKGNETEARKVASEKAADPSIRVVGLLSPNLDYEYYK